MKKKQVTPYPLRLEPDMELRAKEQAKKERRSFNAWLKVAVEERLERTVQEVAA